MGLGDRLEHFVLGHFAGKALDHAHGLFAAGDDQVEIALLQVVLRGERYPLAIDAAQPYGGDRSLERQRRDAQAGTGTVHGQHVGIVLTIAGNDEGLDLHFVVEPFGKQRTNRPIDQTRGERLFHGRATFALQEAAGKLAGRGGALAIVAGEREEIDARSRGAGGGGNQDHGLAVLHQATAGSLLGEKAGLE